MPFKACRGFVYGAVNPIAESISSFLLEPEYSCQYEIKVCSTDYYTKLDPTDYVDRLMADKPTEIQSNDFIQKLYNEIAADPEPRKNLTMIQFTDLHLDL